MDDEIIDVKVARNTTKVESLEDNVSQLWKKWDTMQKTLIATLAATIMNLIGIIAIVATK